MRMFATPEGDAGFALKGDDIVSVFKHPKAPYRNVTRSMMDLATSQGGRRLDAFDTVLPKIYSQSGFRAVARLPWNEDYKPEGWKHEAFKPFKNGRPDVVFMAHDPQAGSYQPWDGRQIADYDEGETHQRAALAEIDRRGNRPAPPGPEAYGSGQLIRMSDPTTIWHGTPHKFPPTRANPLGEFDLSKIGTGEGAQAYGHGQYAAGNEAVAEGYRRTLAGPKTPGDLLHDGTAFHNPPRGGARFGDVFAALDTHQGNFDRAIGDPSVAEGVRDKLREWHGKGFEYQPSETPGALYQAELHIHPEHMLDWDKPLAEHSLYVQERLGKLGIDSPQKPDLRTIRDPIIRGIVRDAQRQDPEARNLGLMIDNDSFLYNKAMLHAQRAGVDMDDISAGDYVTQHAKPYIDQANLHGGSTGEFAHRKLAGDANDRAAAAKALLSAGIPGIRYLDRGSRAAGQGTSNYVVFDPHTINIVRRNGLPAMVEAGADALRDHKRGTP